MLPTLSPSQLDLENRMTDIDPVFLYNTLIEGSRHAAKRRGLEIINTVCSERFEAKATDWSVAAIGRVSEARGGPRASSLRQPALQQYRALISAWAKFSEIKHPKARQKLAGETDSWIDGIENIAARQLVYIMQKDLKNSNAEIRRLQNLRSDGGRIKITARTSKEIEDERGLTPNQIREVKRFLITFVDNEEFLRAKGFVRLGDEIIDSDSGAVIMGKVVSQLLRRVGGVP